MTPAPIVFLKPRQLHRVLCGHVWIYRGEIDRVEGALEDGAVADVLTHTGRFIGRGYANTRSEITIRLLTRAREAIDEPFWKQRLGQAVEYRRRRYPGRAALRWVNGEADALPGLIVDQYDRTIVLQTNTLAMDRQKTLLTRLLVELLSPEAVLENNTNAARQREGLEAISGVLYGQCPDRLAVRVGQARLVCDLQKAHKTGLYLDQQVNYEKIGGTVKPGMRILDAFCHTAGFAIHSLLAGASTATAIDSSDACLELARQSARASGVADRLTFVSENAFDYLKRAPAAGERFDLVILDPPSFTGSRHKVEAARRGYKEIHVRALTLLNPGGLLATFCCSHHVSAPLFLDTILEAAADVNARLRREEILTAAPDHPVLPAIPETEYLKGYLFTLLP